MDKAKADSIAKSKKDALQPYAKVITGKAKTMDGFFKVHYVDGKYFFEIADSLFGRDILIVNRVVKAPVDAQKRKVGYPGDYISDEVIRSRKDAATNCSCVKSLISNILLIHWVCIRPY